MLQIFKEFQNLLINGDIEMECSLFNETIYKFSFTFLTKENINLLLNIKIKSFEFILIDQIIDFQNENFFVFCFNFSLFIINQSDFSLVHPFFNQNKNSIIYCLNNNLQNELKLSSKTISFNFSKEDQSILIYKEIPNFLKRFSIKNGIVKNFWNLIQKIISGFLIKKSYSDSYFKRILDKPLKFERELKEIQFLENECVYLRKLGQQVSSVELYYHIKTGKLLALKIPQNDTFLPLIERERKNYLNLDYLFLLKYYGYSTVHNQKCIAIEFINGENLDEIKEIKLDKIDKLCIIYELILVLHYIHNVGFICRDLKPNNIMIDRDKTMILIDLDRLLNSYNYDENQMVTRDFSHSFIAPEIISNQSFSFSADIYSLGKIIQFIFANESSFPSEFSEICNQCIQTDPKKRPTIDEIMNKFTSYFLFNDEGNDEVKKRLLSVFDSAFLYDNKEKGMGRALFELGSTHQTMRIPNHLKRNFQYFQNAADLNDIESIMILGNEYYKSNKINKAIQYYSKASDLQCSMANRKLGDIYFDKIGGYYDYDKAIYYYMKAIQQTKDLHSLLNAAEICFIKHEFKTGVKCFKLAADQNDALSQYNMGVFYLYGIYCVKDVNLGFKYLHLAASQNYSMAQKMLGDLYLQGKLIRRDVQKAIDYYEAAAKQNEIEPCYILGVIYYDNFYVPRDINKAIYYLTIAAECDYVNAQYNLGVIYFEGKYVKQDIEKCIYYTSKAVKKNNYEAPLLLGYVYSVPAYGHKDINKAIHYLSISANFGNDHAQVHLGHIYRWGIDVPIDIDRSIFYYQAASNNNNSYAQLELGKIYLYIKKDADKGLFHMQSAANNGNPYAQYHLGILNLNGELFPSNINKALYYLGLSASKFNIDAQYQLGLLYEEGIHVPVDLNKASYYLTLAANQNHKSAQCHLAYLYLKRNSSNPTINKAIYYFTRSAEQGSKSARFALATFYYEGKHVPRDINKAIDYFKQLSSLNSQFAKNNLGIIYKNGDGVKQNIMMSIEYFNEAIKQENDLVSMFNLAHIYFFEEGVDLDLDIAIYLLMNSIKISYSFKLLCLAMVTKYEKITLPDVNNELQVSSHDKFLAIQIYSHIAIYDLLNEASYKKSYEYLKNVELVYDIDHNYVLRSNFEKKNEKDDLKKIKDINDLFYEGFGEVVDDSGVTDN